MSEFNSRILAQRNTLKAINEFRIYKEPLFSLSEKAINRWVKNNMIDPQEKYVLLVTTISKKLFFLANKSQEQITEDYKELSNEVSELIIQIKDEMASTALQRTSR